MQELRHFVQGHPVATLIGVTAWAVVMVALVVFGRTGPGEGGLVGGLLDALHFVVLLAIMMEILVAAGTVAAAVATVRSRRHRR